MKKTGLYFRILVIALVIVAIMLPISATAATNVDSEVDYSDYDLSKPGSGNGVEITVEDFLNIICGDDPISDIEKKYLSDYSYINVKYDTPTSQYVTVTAKGDTVTVSAVRYSYTAVNGQRVVWNPVSVSIDGVDKDIALHQEGDDYVGVISGVSIDDSTAVRVKYTFGSEFILDKDDVNGALNSAYNTAVSMNGEYNAAEDAYNAAYSEYIEYLKLVEQFNIDNQKYNAYLDELAIYREELVKYNEYLKELSDYEKALAEYEKYLEEQGVYDQYLNDLEAYGKNLEKYNEYLGKMELIKAQLNMLDTGLYGKVTELQRDLYSCMFAGLVDQVVENKDLFVSGAKANPYAIDGASTATTNIRKMLREYEVLTTDADKYAFYISNYESLKSNMSKLAACLYDLYGNKTIRTRMHSEGKTEKYVIMIAQLVVFSNALNGGPVSVSLKDAGGNNRTITLKNDTTITYLTGAQQPYLNVTKNMLEILGGNEYVKSPSVIAPLAGGFPQEVKEPTLPTGPDGSIPVDPEDIDRPTAPAQKLPPVEPEKVEKPNDVPHMDEPVKAPVLTDNEYLTVIEALNKGTIFEREELDEDFVYIPEIEVEKKIISADNVTVNFYDSDNTTVLYRVITTKYSSVAYEGAEPKKASTDHYAYYFTGWTYQDGTAANLTSVQESVDIYPAFRAVEIITIEFYDTDGKTLLHTVKQEIGNAAAFEGKTPEKTDDDAVYTFSGWVDANGEAYDLSDPTVSAKLYPAFDATPYIYVTFYGSDSTVLYIHKLLPGETAVYGGEIPTKESDAEADYVFTHWVDGDGNRHNLGITNESIDLYPSFAVTEYIILTFHGANGEVISEERILKGVSYTFNEELIPVKDSVPEADYIFSGWVDINGNSYDLLEPDHTCELYPAFDTVPCAVIKFFDTDRVTVIYELRVRIGSECVFEGTLPTKETDESGRYAFSHWIDESGNEFNLDSVAKSSNLYPCFDITPYVTVTFYGADGVTVLATVSVLKGESVVYDGEIPVKPSEPEADYTFAGSWTDSDGNPFDMSSVTESVSLHPEFNSIRYIVVNFYAYDRVTLLDSVRVRPGQNIIYSGATPERMSDDTAKYTFSHWVDASGVEYNFERLGESADFYPVFNATPYLNIVFYAADRVTVIGTFKVLEGDSLNTLPEAEKESDGNYGYKFKYWGYADGTECDFSAIGSSMEIYPYFDRIPYVTVVFIGNGNATLHTARVLKGSEAVFEGELPKGGSNIVADYVFDGWADSMGRPYDLSSVESDVTLYPYFKAVYKEYELDNDYNGTGMTQYTVDLGAHNFVDVPVEHFISVALQNRGSLLIETDEISVRFSYASVSALKKAGVAYIQSSVTKSGSAYRCNVILKDSKERVIDANVEITFSFACSDATFAAASGVVYTNQDGKLCSVLKKYENGRIVFDAYTAIRYNVAVLRDINVSGNNPIDIEVSADRAEPGYNVSVTVNGDIPVGKTLVLYYYDTQSVKHVISNGSFVMPNSNVTVYADLTDTIYTVTFISDGKILTAYQYKYGDTALIPRDPTKQNDSQYSYTFVGWSAEIGEVTADATYHAVFESTLLVEEDAGIQIADKYLNIIKIALIAFASGAVLVIIIVITKRPRGFAPF